MNLYVAVLYHAYQPWWQFLPVLDRITRECYRPIFQRVVAEPGFKYTFNITGSLVELWGKHGYTDMLELLKQLAQAQHVELTLTLGHHPLAPYISQEEFGYQVYLQEKLLKPYIGTYPYQGFYLPEFAFHDKVLPWIVNTGCTWTMVDDQSLEAAYGKEGVPFNTVPFMDGVYCPAKSSYWSFHKIAQARYKEENGRVIEDSRIRGSTLAYQLAEEVSAWTQGQDGYVVIGMDLETRNHHLPSYWDICDEEFLYTITHENPYGVKIRLVTVRELLTLFPKREMRIPPGSQSTSGDQWRCGNYFPLWFDTGDNRYLHQLLWELAGIVREAPHHTEQTREEEAKSLASCGWWWIAVMGRLDFTMRQIDKMVEVADRAGSPLLFRAYEIRMEFERLLIEQLKSRAGA